MRKLTLLAGAAMLVLSAPFALAQGNGKGQGGGGHSAEHRGGKDDKGGGKGNRGGEAGKGRGNGPDRVSKPREARGNSDRRELRRASAERGRGNDRAIEDRRAERRDDDRDIRRDRDRRRSNSDREIMVDRRGGPEARIVRASAARDPVRFRRFEGSRYRWEPRQLTDCPPGLAKKNNGCLPPGQARRIAAADRDSYFYRYANWYEPTPRYDWRYSEGYAYRVEPSSGLISSFLPLLGGALYPGQAWPASYTDYEVDPYYDSYYGSGDPYDYRYADGALLAVDPATQAITAIAALLTGDDWSIGSAMPMGYDAYNVPPPYRDRYYDTDQDWYRYSDGYVHRIEPRTRLVRETILLPV